MKKLQDLTYSNYKDTKALLTQELSSALKPTPAKPRVLRVNEIHEAPALFQPRTNIRGTFDSHHHIKQLMTAQLNSSGQALDPISVWWSGERWFVIDGEHRLAAHREALARRRIRRVTIPVKTFEGTLAQAERAAIEANKKIILNMTQDDRLDTAWRLIASHTVDSPKGVRDITGAGLTVIKKMKARRDVLENELQERIQGAASEQERRAAQDELSSLADQPWKKIRRDRQASTSEYECENYRDKRAKEIAKALGKAIKPHELRDPELMNAALTKVSPRGAEALADYLAPRDFDDDLVYEGLYPETEVEAEEEEEVDF